MIKLGDNLGHKKPNIINNIRSKGLKKALTSYAFFSRFSFADNHNSKESTGRKEDESFLLLTNFSPSLSGM